jgi:OFA family oxalate/formate antiporter-like MFS transporter
MQTPGGKGVYKRSTVLLASFVIMAVISIYQYSWFLFAYAIESEWNWDLAVIGLAFTIFTYAATFVQPFSGALADSYGPRVVATVASFLVGAGFILTSFAVSPKSLYLCYGLGGLGVGVLYGISTACAVKWFPDKRGFATGLVVFGFGAGTAVFNWYIQGLLESKGLHATFRYLGIFMMVTLIPLSLVYRYPASKSAPPGDKVLQTAGDLSSEFRPLEMLATYQWFLIYFSFVATVSVVLIFGAQMKLLAKEFHIPRSYFDLLLILFPLGNGLSRVVAGAISDKIGRERTMVIFYGTLGLAILFFVRFADVLELFIPAVFLAALLGGAPFALYPATIGDYYGTRYSTTNYGITYTAKAWAGLISGWLSGYLVMRFGSYKIPLLLVAFCSLAAAALSNPRLMKAPTKKGEKKLRVTSYE